MKNDVDILRLRTVSFCFGLQAVFTSHPGEMQHLAFIGNWLYLKQGLASERVSILMMNEQPNVIDWRGTELNQIYHRVYDN